jgi:hypothetical protein
MAKQLASLWPEVDEWLRTSRKGEHIHCFRTTAH